MFFSNTAITKKKKDFKGIMNAFFIIFYILFPNFRVLFFSHQNSPNVLP